MKRNTRWYLLAVIAGALLAGAALWAARAFLTAPVAVLGPAGLAGGLLLFCGLAELLSVQDLDPARRERDREDHDERGAMIRDKARSRAGDVLLWLLGVGPFAAVAAVIALLDLLPVIGTGSVLIPWAVLALLGGESGLGWGLIVLYLVITVARNFLEPRIVGSSIGLPPLLSLVCVYAGLRLFGVLGAVLMPCAALTVLFFLKSNRASPPVEKPE